MPRRKSTREQDCAKRHRRRTSSQSGTARESRKCLRRRLFPIPTATPRGRRPAAVLTADLRRGDCEEVPLAGYALSARMRRGLRTRAPIRSRGRGACWTPVRRSALPVRLRARRCARRSRRCRRRGPRSRRCATLPAPRCRAPAPRRGSTWRSGLRAAGRRTLPGSRRPRCSLRGLEGRASCERTTASCASSNASQSRSPISAAVNHEFD